MDLRHAVRMLGRVPSFALVAGITLALGIGAATAVFSVVNGVLLKALPYPEPQSLVSVWNGPPASESPDVVPLSATQFFTYRDENRTFAAYGLWSTATAAVTGSREPEEVRALEVTHGTLEALAIPPTVGRWFSGEDDSPGSLESVILAGGYWTRRYGSDRSVIGRTMVVDGVARTIVGVMPVTFRFLNETPDLILPFRFNRAELRLGSFNYFGLGRLNPGVTIEAASNDVARMSTIWLNAWPSPPGFDKERFAKAPVLRPLAQDVVGDIGNVLWVLLAVVGAVLLIACANVANLQLARVEHRRQELGVRAALGAGSSRIARELLLESLLVGLFGGALGLALTHAVVRVLIAFGPTSVPRLDDIGIDGVVLAFALVVTGPVAFDMSLSTPRERQATWYRRHELVNGFRRHSEWSRRYCIGTFRNSGAHHAGESDRARRPNTETVAAVARQAPRLEPGSLADPPQATHRRQIDAL